MKDKDVKIIMSICPECGNAIRMSVIHEMDIDDKVKFINEVLDNDLMTKVITYEEYQNTEIQMYCKKECSRKTKTNENGQ